MAQTPSQDLEIQNLKKEVATLKESNEQPVESNRQLNQNVETISVKFENATSLFSDIFFTLNAIHDANSSALYSTIPKSDTKPKGKKEKIHEKRGIKEKD